MTKIDFYQIDQDDHLLFACRLIDKIYQQGHAVHVHTASLAESESLDDLLWSFRPEHFIPHAICQVNEPDDDDTPIMISHEVEPTAHQDVLVNLAGAVPDFFSRFARVAEVVPLDENSRAAARVNYKFYQDRGYQLDYHKLQTKK
ncbi:MAG: DNA polymerase III subunit chi [Pseudomonadales bacterium]